MSTKCTFGHERCPPLILNLQVPLHKHLTSPALEAKKDVFVEWPLGNGLQEAEELAALAKKQGVKTLVGLQSRLSPSIQKVHSSFSVMND